MADGFCCFFRFVVVFFLFYSNLCTEIILWGCSFHFVHTSFGKLNTLTHQAIFCVCLRNGHRICCWCLVVDTKKNDIDFKHSMTGTTVLNHTLSHRHLMSFFFLSVLWTKQYFCCSCCCFFFYMDEMMRVTIAKIYIFIYGHAILINALLFTKRYMVET